jgi:hypothetical protein
MVGVGNAAIDGMPIQYQTQALDVLAKLREVERAIKGVDDYTVERAGSLRKPSRCSGNTPVRVRPPFRDARRVWGDRRLHVTVGLAVAGTGHTGFERDAGDTDASPVGDRRTIGGRIVTGLSCPARRRRGPHRARR